MTFVTKMSSALRELFIIILLFCLPSNPVNLFESHYMEWTDDFIMSASKEGKTLSDLQLRTLVLMDVQKRLQSWDRDLRTFRLPEPTIEEINDIGSSNNEQLPVLIREELEFNLQELAEFATKRCSEFNESQAAVYTEIMDAVRSERAYS